LTATLKAASASFPQKRKNEASASGQIHSDACVIIRDDLLNSHKHHAADVEKNSAKKATPPTYNGNQLPPR